MIMNLTQHPATPEQLAAGVVDLPAPQRAELQDLLTFEEIPTSEEVSARAEQIADLAIFNNLGGDEGDDPHPLFAMIGGALWLMRPLEDALRAQSIKPLYAFSRRESVERIDADGNVIKTNVFRHVGFVGA